MALGKDVHRADVVGSMLRPPELVAARAAMRAGTLSADEYRSIENAAVDATLRIQEEAGVDVVTDGEQRRDIFFDFFISGMDGLSPTPAYTVEFQGASPEDSMEVRIPFSVTSEIKARRCPGLDEFAYASQRTDKPVKVTLPAPTMITGFWGEASRDAYPDPFDLAAEAAEIVAGWMRELADAGCQYIQIDAPDLAEVCADENVRTRYASHGLDPARFMNVGADILGMLGSINTPGALKGMHVCKGNGTRSWIAEGGYEALAELVFARAPGYDVFHLEYDDARSGSFEPIDALPDDKMVVLGLVSTKWTKLEDPDELRTRIDEAAGFHPMERLALATQCGFASAAETAEAKKITPETQFAKLKLVADVAHEVWR